MWCGGSKRDIQRRLDQLRRALLGWYPAEPSTRMPDAAEACVDALAQAGLQPLHWELAFPEVFAREDGGFDAVLGNPPFAGKNNILASNGDEYIRVGQALRPHLHGNADLAAWFVLRAAEILRPGGCFGLVTTNTIKQGDTRESGLKHILEKGFSLYDARTDIPWPGAAAVVVDLVWGCRGASPTDVSLGSTLTNEEVADPVPLVANAGKAFIGTYVLGKGFVLTPDEAAALIAQDPRNGEIIKPYIGGEELNNELPDEDGYVRFNRYVIDFSDRTLDEASTWPTLIDIVRARVKPERDGNNRQNYRDLWWQFGERRPGAYRALRSLKTCVAVARVSKHHTFAMAPVQRIFSEATIVVAVQDWMTFAILQSRVHEAWARHAGLGSTMKTDARYTPSTCFETFPFPRPDAAAEVALATAGEALDRARTAAMRALQVGMTGTLNALLDPLHRAHRSAEIVALREAREAMDAAVLAAYGWSDLAPDDTAGIVRRLRALNAERAREEEAAGVQPKKRR